LQHYHGQRIIGVNIIGLHLWELYCSSPSVEQILSWQQGW